MSLYIYKFSFSHFISSFEQKILIDLYFGGDPNFMIKINKRKIRLI